MSDSNKNFFFITMYNTVNSRHLDFDYLEKLLISKRKSGPCFNTEISNQVTKYRGKEEKLLLGSNISPFHNIFNVYLELKESNYIVICEIWLFKLFFPHYYKSDMSKYGYLEVF